MRGTGNGRRRSRRSNAVGGGDVPRSVGGDVPDRSAPRHMQQSEPVQYWPAPWQPVEVPETQVRDEGTQHSVPVQAPVLPVQEVSRPDTH